MIVIAVIGILAVVLVPKMASVKDSAKVAGVMTNVKSVQSFVTANIDQWATNNTSVADIATSVYQNFSGTNNGVQNPFSSSYAIDSTAGGTGPGSSLGTGDAIHIINSTIGNNGSPYTPTGTEGTVVVGIPAGYVTTEIDVAGVDNKGNIINKMILQP